MSFGTPGDVTGPEYTELAEQIFRTVAQAGLERALGWSDTDGPSRRRPYRLHDSRYSPQCGARPARRSTAASASAAMPAVRSPRRQHSTQRTGGEPGSNGTMTTVGRAK